MIDKKHIYFYRIFLILTPLGFAIRLFSLSLHEICRTEGGTECQIYVSHVPMHIHMNWVTERPTLLTDTWAYWNAVQSTLSLFEPVYIRILHCNRIFPVQSKTLSVASRYSQSSGYSPKNASRTSLISLPIPAIGSDRVLPTCTSSTYSGL